MCLFRLYNSGSAMDDLRGINSFVKELGQLTHSNWVAVLSETAGTWTILTDSIPSGVKRRVRKFLLSAEVFDWANTAAHTSKIYKKQPNDERIGARRISIYPINSNGVILVGLDDTGQQTNKMWMAAAVVLDGLMDNARQTSLLQDALQELENTQQELQARISAQQAAESRLIQTTKLAAVGEMAAGVAHELNNPLTTVVGFSELALDSLDPNSPQAADLTVVLKEARRARDVVRRLLDFSRQSETLRIKADLNEILQDVLSLMQHLFQINGVEVVSNFDNDLPWVLIDRNQMKQVFLNLLHNALNAMPNGGRLSVETSRRSRYDKLLVSVGIKDNGIGIDAGNLPRIFEPFFTTRADQGGTGLGLSVTYGIISEHGGVIEVESTPNGGSTFTVLLPIEASK